MREGVDHEKFLRAYESEINFFAPQLLGRKIKTIFFGGGTPSLMPAQLVEKILNKISASWEVDKNCEITLEANPTSFESEKFKDFKRAGVNRLSVGVQALNNADLKFLGREHSASEALQTLEKASKIFENFSFDLIYARPLQSLEQWSQELQQALDFGANHMSLYQLTIEKGTKFFSDFQQKKFTMPNENLAADFYDLTNQLTASKGLELYEISNYAKKNFECAHNLVYWQGGDYLGIGAGAHSRVFLDGEKNRSAIMMLHEPMAWLNKAQNNNAAIQTITKITAEELREELILMGLRLRDGISAKIFQEYFGKKLSEIFNFKKLETLASQGLIEFDEEKIKITHQGRILTNAIIEKISTTNP